MPPKSRSTFVEKIPFAEWANLNSHLIWIYDGPVEPRYRSGSILNEHLGAWLVKSGHVVTRMNRLTLRAHAGQWLVPPMGNLWREVSDDARLLSVRFQINWPTGEELFNDGLGFVFDARDHPELERDARPLARFAARHFPSAHRFLMDEPATLVEHLRLQALCARWMDTFVETVLAHGIIPSRMGRIDARVLQAMRMLDRYPFARTPSERELAQSVGLSVSQLMRLFVRQFGASPRAYFDRRRLGKAVAALQSTDQAVKEIAFDLGFSSLPHFSAWFRRRHGMSPRELRNKIARGHPAADSLRR